MNELEEEVEERAVVVEIVAKRGDTSSRIEGGRSRVGAVLGEQKN